MVTFLVNLPMWARVAFGVGLLFLGGDLERDLERVLRLLSRDLDRRFLLRDLDRLLLLDLDLERLLLRDLDLDLDGALFPFSSASLAVEAGSSGWSNALSSFSSCDTGGEPAFTGTSGSVPGGTGSSSPGGGGSTSSAASEADFFFSSSCGWRFCCCCCCCSLPRLFDVDFLSLDLDLDEDELELELDEEDDLLRPRPLSAVRPPSLLAGDLLLRDRLAGLRSLDLDLDLERLLLRSGDESDEDEELEDELELRDRRLRPRDEGIAIGRFKPNVSFALLCSLLHK